MKLLIVDDDRDLVELLTFALQRADFDVVAAHDAPTALTLLENERPDLAVLDIMLGGWDGLDLLKDLRRRSQIPVIMLTARVSDDDKVVGLELGADDYLTKPFSYRELIARIRAHLRRNGHAPAAAAPAATLLVVGPITINVAEHTTAIDGQPLNLSVTEFRLLHFLMTHVGAVVPMSTVLKHVWGYEAADGTEVVRVTLHRLRHKLEADPAHPRLLHTLPGVGVVLKPEPDGSSAASAL